MNTMDDHWLTLFGNNNSLGEHSYSSFLFLIDCFNFLINDIVLLSATNFLFLSLKNMGSKEGLVVLEESF